MSRCNPYNPPLMKIPPGYQPSSSFPIGSQTSRVRKSTYRDEFPYHRPHPCPPKRMRYFSPNECIIPEREPWQDSFNRVKGDWSPPRKQTRAEFDQIFAEGVREHEQVDKQLESIRRNLPPSMYEEMRRTGTWIETAIGSYFKKCCKEREDDIKYTQKMGKPCGPAVRVKPNEKL